MNQTNGSLKTMRKIMRIRQSKNAASNYSIVLLKFIAAYIAGKEFILSSGIFSAIGGTKEIHLADAKTLLVQIQKLAFVRKFAAGAAALALPLAVCGNRQNTCNSTFNFRSEVIFSKKFSHSQKR
jgi:hypothetical protein